MVVEVMLGLGSRALLCHHLPCDDWEAPSATVVSCMGGGSRSESEPRLVQAIRPASLLQTILSQPRWRLLEAQ